MTEFQPLYDLLVIEPIVEEGETKTAAGVIVPATAQEKPQTGTVIARGSGRLNRDGSVAPLSVQVGDEVLYAKFSGTEVSADGKKVLFLHESDVLARVWR